MWACQILDDLRVFDTRFVAKNWSANWMSVWRLNAKEKAAVPKVHMWEL